MDNSTIIMKIEIRLKELGMSKKEFYAGSGISSATYSQWNTNQYKPSRRKLKQVADFLGITVEYLLGEEEKPTSVAGDGLSEDEKALVEIFRHLSDEGQGQLMVFANYAASTWPLTQDTPSQEQAG